MTYPFLIPPPAWVPGPYKATPPPSPNGPGVVTPHVARWYTVQPGDSLWSIARHFYDKPSEWVRIFNANLEGVNRPDNSPGPLVSSDVQVGERLHIP